MVSIRLEFKEKIYLRKKENFKPNMTFQIRLRCLYCVIIYAKLCYDQILNKKPLRLAFKEILSKSVLK